MKKKKTYVTSRTIKKKTATKTRETENRPLSPFRVKV